MPNNNFTWVSFYKELANSLLKYKNSRKELLSFIYTKLDPTYTNYLHDSDGTPLDNICPFTVFGIFNRGIKNANRTIIAGEFKRFFNLKIDVPNDFDGIPVLNNQKSHFFGFREHRKADDIENLWSLFEQALSDPYKIEKIFNKVITQYCINVNITMGLYWIDPDNFVALDKLNREYLKYCGLSTGANVPRFKDYLQLMQYVKDRMRTGEIPENSFPQLSYTAWKQDYYNEPSNSMNTELNNIINSLLELKKNIILQGAPGTGKTRAAKDFAEQMIFGSISDNKTLQAQRLNSSKQYKLVQFHPSYSYEDLVRGVKVELEDGKPNYKTVDKVLGLFAKEALKNWTDSKKDIEEITKELTYEQTLKEFKEYVEELIAEGKEYKIPNTSASIVSVEEDSFRYSFPNRPTIFYTLLYSDILKVCMRKGLILKSVDVESVGLIMKGKHPYYYHLFNALEEFKNKRQTSVEIEKVDLQNYIFVIDEINRANLPVVLGELIYALEYRDEKVDSMYELDDNSPLILPPNLYIIGTMNTADRSVGQIDYAIRRRFAFMDLLPQELGIEAFDTNLFEQVSNLFISNYDEFMDGETDKLERSEYLSPEFRPEDVWLGHSYFIMRNNDEGYMDEDYRNMRLDYEIRPILREYLKDGILNPSAEKYINDIQYT